MGWKKFKRTGKLINKKSPAKWNRAMNDEAESPMESNRNTHYEIVSLSHFVLPFIYFIIHGDCSIQRWAVSFVASSIGWHVAVSIFLPPLYFSHRNIAHVFPRSTHTYTNSQQSFTFIKSNMRPTAIERVASKKQLNAFTIVLFSIGFLLYA